MITRTFSKSDQISFARVSRDYNPVHLDEVAARRTMIGRTIVHGIHIALWMMDQLAQSGISDKPFGRISARFNRPLFVDELATLQIRGDALGADMQCLSDGALLTQMKFSNPSACGAGTWDVSDTPGDAPWSCEPAQLSVEAIAAAHGFLILPYTTSELNQMFPAAAKFFGIASIAHVMALTRIVGMQVPGLHSLFGGFTVDLLGGSGNRLGFSTARFNKKTSHIQLKVSGDVLSGTIDAFMRPQSEPVDYAVVTRQVRGDEFANRRALIIGGSRGLGLVCAYILAAGGAEVSITYRVGRDEAETAADTIRSHGGKAMALMLDVASPDEGVSALAGRAVRPTDVYYFATPHIFERKKALFEPAIFDRFSKCYVTDFARLIDACLDLNAPDNVNFFYPSSDALNHPIKELLEYSSAKAAGEALCEMIARFSPRARILVKRLPRLPTDQTATILKVGAADPAVEMLAICREMAALPALAASSTV